MNSYRDLFLIRGTIGFSVAALLARMSLPMTGIGIITMLAQVHGSYGLAGMVAATFVLTYALAAPQISRLVDRYGQYRVLPGAAAISVVGLIALAACTWLNGPNWLLYLSAVLAGFMPTMSAMTRARWTALLRGKSELQSAYSFETVLDELTFIAGPPLSVGASVVLVPQAGLIAAAAMLALGVVAFAAQRRTEPPISTAVLQGAAERSLIRDGGVAVLALVLLAMGVIVGTVDIVSVAFAEQRGEPAAASLVLASYAIGSCFAGLAFGAVKLAVPLPRLLLLGGLATAATTLPFLAVGSITALSLAVFVAGLFFAPTMIVAMALVERMVTEAKLTEGLTWLLSGLNTGTAIGAATAGQAVDTYGIGGGFSVAVVAGTVVLFASAIGYSVLSARFRTADLQACHP